ncbi:uncharacterized protein PHACADRAFT_259768 [Phanerochaete carnosa HHB-10118-sp]|uniref:Uncharacterized protein n=1 Tax=Phanerochaete carnosa (strain HHB-10118-sp) TaxID=650164 RepID=K5VPN4_PHACS|nr:uncharacterized protein PHACADRAFT_259768 [Phanerochaete carnosa HHB-10118-sp]EKM53408.1 hypothetical protein PHACADRAFT_259768 [Phanerochaete carnosa HHB-10118-sp]
MRSQIVRHLVFGLLATLTVCNAAPPAADRLDLRDMALSPRADMIGVNSGETGSLLVTGQRASVAPVTNCTNEQCAHNATAVINAEINGATALGLWTCSAIALAAAGSVLVFFA